MMNLFTFLWDQLTDKKLCHSSMSSSSSLDCIIPSSSASQLHAPLLLELVGLESCNGWWTSQRVNGGRKKSKNFLNEILGHRTRAPFARLHPLQRFSARRRWWETFSPAEMSDAIDVSLIRSTFHCFQSNEKLTNSAISSSFTWFSPLSLKEKEKNSRVKSETSRRYTTSCCCVVRTLT